eukprot:gene2447-8772_t
MSNIEKNQAAKRRRKERKEVVISQLGTALDEVNRLEQARAAKLLLEQEVLNMDTVELPLTPEGVSATFSPRKANASCSSGPADPVAKRTLFALLGVDGFCHANPSLQEKARNALLYFLAMAMLVGIVDLKSSGLGRPLWSVQLSGTKNGKKRLQGEEGSFGNGVCGTLAAACVRFAWREGGAYSLWGER